MKNLLGRIGWIAALGLAACGGDDGASLGGGAGQPGVGGAAGTGGPAGSGGEAGTAGQAGIGGAGGAAGVGGSGGSAGVGGAAGNAGVGGSGGEAGQAGSGGTPSTHGQGGLDCTPATTAYDGQPYCLATVGDIELKLFVPQIPAGPMQIAVYLHGDTANGYYEDWGYEALSAWATSQGLLFFAALAPNGCSWWRPKSSCYADQYDSGYNAEQLVAAIDAIGEGYDVYKSNLLFVGYSGGSTFLTRHFIPMYGNVYSGTMVLNCGGVEPQPFDWSPTPATIAPNPMFYTFGSEDFMTQYIYPSMEEYDGMGFAVEPLELPGYDHCDGAYDWDGRTISLWGSHLL